MPCDPSRLPIINVESLVADVGDRTAVADQIAKACRESGFFYIIGHQIDDGLQTKLEDLSRRFFAQSTEQKLEIRMEKGGRAWRGYFPIGRELTSGKPDLKEGLYFGAELDAEHPLVKSGTPMHGPNLFPDNIPAFRETILEYITAMTGLGHAVMRGIALSLGLSESYFDERYTNAPLILFRIFNYPARPTEPADSGWGVGEHTDYGLLTILKQDRTGGLQVKSKSGWIDAAPVPNSFVCNIGDMLDKMTGGLYRSTAHRVKSPAEHDRLSFPFFFDPNFNAEVKPIDLERSIDDDRGNRWDRASVHDFGGTYGDYLLNKVARVFPQLRRDVL